MDTFISNHLTNYCRFHFQIFIYFMYTSPMNYTNITYNNMVIFGEFPNGTEETVYFNVSDPDGFGINECKNCALVNPAETLLIVCFFGMCLQLVMIYAAFCMKQKYRQWIADIPLCCRTPRLVRDIEMQYIA